RWRWCSAAANGQVKAEPASSRVSSIPAAAATRIASITMQPGNSLAADWASKSSRTPSSSCRDRQPPIRDKHAGAEIVPALLRAGAASAPCRLADEGGRLVAVPARHDDRREAEQESHDRREGKHHDHVVQRDLAQGEVRLAVREVTPDEHHGRTGGCGEN